MRAGHLAVIPRPHGPKNLTRDPSAFGLRMTAWRASLHRAQPRVPPARGPHPGTRASWPGGRVREGRGEDPHQVERIGGGDPDRLALPLLAPDAPQALDRLGQGVLLANRARDEAPAADGAAGLAPAQGAQHISPGTVKLSRAVTSRKTTP